MVATWRTAQLGVVLVAVGLGGAVGPVGAEARWTVLAYLSGDGSLEEAALGYLDELAAARIDDGIRVVAQIDRCPGYSEAWGDFSEARRLTLGDCQPHGRRSWVETGWAREVNMGDAATLTEFVEWGIGSFPAERYMVLLMGHGSAIREIVAETNEPPAETGVAYDATDGGDSLTVRETGTACRRVADRLGRPIDVLAVDACFSATVELAYEVMGSVEWLAASPDLLYEPGVPWGKVLEGAAQWPSPEGVARAGVRKLRELQEASADERGSYVAVSVSGGGELVAALRGLASALTTGMDESAGVITLAKSRTRALGLHSEMLELGGFLQEVGRAARDSNLVGIAERADAAGEILDGVVVETFAGDGSVAGLGIFFPPNLSPYPQDYSDLGSFAAEAGWGPMLEAYLGHIRGLMTRELSRPAG